MSRLPESLARAYDACERLAQSHYENFPVASRLLPAPMRPHVAAVYAFARVADDVADEGTAPPHVRQTELRNWQHRLHEAVTAADGNLSSGNRDDLIVAALAHSIRSLELPLSLFDDLLSAFGQDTTTTRYDSWRDVLDYCRRSANPIGRLVLRIAGIRNDALDRSSDALCTALQLTNFWQDFGRDWRAAGCTCHAKCRRAAGREKKSSRARRCRVDGPRPSTSAQTRPPRSSPRAGLSATASAGRLRLELRLTWLGGRRVLDRVRGTGANLMHERPTLGAADVPGLLWAAARWRRDAA